MALLTSPDWKARIIQYALPFLAVIIVIGVAREAAFRRNR
jgi:hypothetical protein